MVRLVALGLVLGFAAPVLAQPLQPPNTSHDYTAISADALYFDGVGVTVPEISGAEGRGTITLHTDGSGAIDTVTFDVPRFKFNFKELSNATPIKNFNDPTFVPDVLGRIAARLQDVNNNRAAGTEWNVFVYRNLQSSAWGVWATTVNGLNDPHSDAVGAFAIGNLTPTSSMPTHGAATYNGLTTGIGANGTQRFAVAGDALVVAAFDIRSVTLRFSNLVTQNVSPGPNAALGEKGVLPSFSGAGSISGNGYTASLVGAGLTGNASGAFYGSAAQETAGVWKVQGGATKVVGSFGAKR
jgi:hypothetical protein